MYHQYILHIYYNSVFTFCLYIERPCLSPAQRPCYTDKAISTLYLTAETYCNLAFDDGITGTGGGHAVSCPSRLSCMKLGSCLYCIPLCLSLSHSSHSHQSRYFSLSHLGTGGSWSRAWWTVPHHTFHTGKQKLPRSSSKRSTADTERHELWVLLWPLNKREVER